MWLLLSCYCQYNMIRSLWKLASYTEGAFSYLFKRLTIALCLKEPNVNVAMPCIIQEIFSNNLNMYFFFKTQGMYPFLIYNSDFMNRPKNKYFQNDDGRVACFFDVTPVKFTWSSRAMVPWKWSGNRYLCTMPGAGLWYVQYYNNHTIKIIIQSTLPHLISVSKSLHTYNRVLI